MPTTNRSITIEPGGRSVVVDITGGTLYEQRDSAHAVVFPVAITGIKAFWVADTATYTVTVRTEVGVVVASTTVANTDPHAVVTCDFRLVAAQNVLVSSTLVEVVPNLKADGAIEIDGALNHDGTTVGFYGATPATQPTAVADAAGGAVIDAEVRTALNGLLAKLRTLGVIAT